MTNSKQKWILVRPNIDGTVACFFCGVGTYSTGYGEGQAALTTELLSEAEVFEQDEDTMQYILNKMPCLSKFSAIPIQDIDIFKAKLAGK